MTAQDRTELPDEIAHRFTRPFARFLQVEAVSGVLLLLATATALGLANSAWSAPFLGFWEIPIGLHFGGLDFSRSLRLWINDGLITFFFFVIALEFKREITIGELKTLRSAALPFSGALGGMIVPVLLYLAIMGGRPGTRGWGMVMATDTAFVMAGLALFGNRIPPSLRLFLLSLAIFDDLGAIVVVALAYSGSLNGVAFALGAAGLAVVAIAARSGVRSVPVYFLFGGWIWLCFDASGIHTTTAGVALGLMTPTRVWVGDERLRGILSGLLSNPVGEHWSGDTTTRRDLRRAGVAVSEALSPVERLEMMLHPWAGFVIIPIFALANAGVVISGVDFGAPVLLATAVGLVVGKPVGVFAFSWLVVRCGIGVRPPDLTLPHLAAGALLTGIGFTMSVFVATLALSPARLDSAKLGILIASLTSGLAGLLLLAWLTRRRSSS